MLDDLNPPKDESGEVIPHDAAHLCGDALMLRGVPPEQIVTDENYGCLRLSSAVFQNKLSRHGHLSFNSQECIEARGLDPKQYMTERGWTAVVSIGVAKFRQHDPDGDGPCRWKIGMVPLPDETPPDICHGGAWATINRTMANNIRRQVDWLIEAPGVIIDETTFTA